MSEPVQAPDQESAEERYERIAHTFDRSDRWMLMLAGVAVGIYMADLRGVWRSLDVQHSYELMALFIDSVFVVDLLLKCYLLRKKYTKSVWFLIDVLSALPILASMAVLPSSFAGLRVARGIRLFRMLRMLRTLRVLRAIRLFQFVKPPPDRSKERKVFERTLTVGVLIYTGLFLSLMGWVSLSQIEGEIIGMQGPGRNGNIKVELALPPPPGTRATELKDREITLVDLPTTQILRSADEIEFYFVLGSILGMLLIVVVARAQVPAIASHQVRTILNVALPQQVADHLMKKPEDYDHTVAAPATIVFADIRGFTTAVEALGDDLATLKTHLEDAMDAVVQVHHKYDLIVDKFIGDCVMSFRGGDLVEGTPEEHAWRVVRAAIEATRALAELKDPYFQQIRTGGASGDDVLVGTFGTSSRLSYTVLGDRVNLAARLESAGKPLGVANLFCGRTRELTAGRDDIVWRTVGTLRAEGKTEAVSVHEAFFSDDDLSWLEGYEAAIAAYAAKEFQAALDGFMATDAAREGGDGTSKFYVPMCHAALGGPLPEDWSATLALKK